ncbi:FAD-binding oxidoreductase [Segnochrobactrum spirostomi]|uniref:FAD-binding oxidoreductase n=1 Tax=Segnochrobactrum spirostomi TaxID=2608987 RepID=A0A6A7Y082_9HYPH|nr:FAD-binding oxidoreductase [Segnochrobactrum spirostomi]MQT11571.1 FAD-binding oxidoreductase [Segnochrobactrum spirostomi]
MAALRSVVGDAGLLTEAADRAAFESDWRRLRSNPALCIVLPRSTAEVAAVMRLCADAGIAVVPQGGNTGLVAGAVPVADAPQIVLSLRRMAAIRTVDPDDDSLVVEAGATLVAVQEAAAKVDRLFPLSLASEGTAQIGGLVSTNAGGLQVLAYGSMRALVLGLEVVLPNGRVWNGLSTLRKDNTGLDLKHLFVGTEGTLGIVTAACLRLFPAIRRRATAFVGVVDVAAATALFRAAQARAAGALTMCEFVAGDAMRLVARRVADARPPFEAPAYVLLELSSPDPDAPLDRTLEALLEEALEAERAMDAVIAQSERERLQLLRLREEISEAELAEGGAVKHDIAVPLSRIAETVAAIEDLVAERFPGCRPNIFGHLGDGNLHVNVLPPEGRTVSDLGDLYGTITEAVEALAVARQGTFSAEHGVGQMRAASLARFKDPVDLDLMRTVKHALDPAGRLNPGKILRAEGTIPRDGASSGR